MNFLIINAGCRINGQGGTLSAAMAELAERTLKHHGHCVVVTDLNEPYVVADEVKKILDSCVQWKRFLIHCKAWAVCQRLVRMCQ